MKQVVVLPKELFDQIKKFINEYFEEGPGTVEHHTLGENIQVQLLFPSSFQIVEVEVPDET
jgi:hypothetical protein